MGSARRGNPHRGSSFDRFLVEEGIEGEVNALAAKEMLAMELAQALKESKLTKSKLAVRMQTTRDTIDRMLNPDDPSINLETMERAASALGKRLSIHLVES